MNIIIEVGKDGIDRALKLYKNKFRNTKIGEKLRDKKEFTKKSVKRRAEIDKAKYINNKNLDTDN